MQKIAMPIKDFIHHHPLRVHCLHDTPGRDAVLRLAQVGSFTTCPGRDAVLRLAHEC